MSIIKYQTKNIVRIEKADWDDEYITTKDWSNLLEAALNNDASLSFLISQASQNELQLALNQIEKTRKLIKPYPEPQYVYVGWMNGEQYDVYSASITSEQLDHLKSNFFKAIIEENYKHPHLKNLSFSWADKREFERQLLLKVNSAESTEAVEKIYFQYLDSPLLKHQRSFLFKSTYNKIKVNFINTIAEKMLAMMEMQEGGFEASKEKLSLFTTTIFNSEHAKHGVDNSILNRFNSKLKIDYQGPVMSLG